LGGACAAASAGTKTATDSALNPKMRMFRFIGRSITQDNM
jgi:hypothetical protein